MKNIKSIIIAVVIVVLAAVGIVGYRNYHKSQIPATQVVAEQRVVEYNGEDGKTAFELLKSKYVIESTDSSFGVMVNSINGLKSTAKEFWLYSVNDKMSDVGADKYITKSTDKIKWEYKSS